MADTKLAMGAARLELAAVAARMARRGPLREHHLHLAAEQARRFLRVPQTRKRELGEVQRIARAIVKRAVDNVDQYPDEAALEFRRAAAGLKRGLGER